MNLFNNNRKTPGYSNIEMDLDAECKEMEDILKVYNPSGKRYKVDFISKCEMNKYK